MPTVWVTQDRPGFNYADAERFGDIQFVTDREFTIPMHAPGNARVRSAILEAVSKFNPDEDSLLLSGSPVVAGVIIGKIVAKYAPKFIRVVKWDNRATAYSSLDIEV